MLGAGHRGGRGKCQSEVHHGGQKHDSDKTVPNSPMSTITTISTVSIAYSNPSTSSPSTFYFNTVTPVPAWSLTLTRILPLSLSSRESCLGVMTLRTME